MAWLARGIGCVSYFDHPFSKKQIFTVCWLLKISVPKNASPMALSDSFLLHLYIGQMAIYLLTLLFTALFENGYPK